MVMFLILCSGNDDVQSVPKGFNNTQFVGFVGEVCPVSNEILWQS